VRVLSLVPKPDPVERRPPLGGLDPIWTAAALLALALVAWIVTVARMQGMDDGPGTSLGTLGWFLGAWTTMMAAMMLPSVEPTVLLFTRISRQRRTEGRSGPAAPWLFVAAYLAVWTGFGLVAFALFRLVGDVDLGFLAWDRSGPAVAGAVLVLAGLYELTPLKEACLRHCRNPFEMLFFGWRDGALGGAGMGAAHGLACVGCCLGLMTALFALGFMSLVWMTAIAAVIFAEKVFVFGAGIRRPLAVALVVLGVWVAVAPASVPALVQPGGAPAMPMGA
jgi:predicted metal-binding membrane protein